MWIWKTDKSDFEFWLCCYISLSNLLELSKVFLSSRRCLEALCLKGSLADYYSIVSLYVSLLSATVINSMTKCNLNRKGFI